MSTEIYELINLLFQRGGWVLIGLVLLSVFTLAATFASAINLIALKPFSSTGVLSEFTAHIEKKLAVGEAREIIEEDAQITAQGYLRRARTGFRFLEFVVTAAPLLGLLGTVLGMISAFQAMQIAGENLKPADFAGGIWEALITTAAGMIVALMALGFHTLLESMVDHFRYRLEVTANEVLTSETSKEKGEHDSNSISAPVSPLALAATRED